MRPRRTLNCGGRPLKLIVSCLSHVLPSEILPTVAMNSVSTIFGKIIGGLGVAVLVGGALWLRYFSFSFESMGWCVVAMALGSALAITGFGRWNILLFKLFGLRKHESANKRLERP